MKVRLIAHTPEPEKVVAAAAKLCYSNAHVDDLLDGLTEKKSREFVQKLASMGHESPTEHASFTFAIEGVSRSLLAQITRHRIASFSVQSQRYVNLHEFSYVLPPEIAQDEEAAQAFDGAMREQAQQYQRLTEILKEKHRQAFLAEGKDEKKRPRAMAEKKSAGGRALCAAQRLRHENDHDDERAQFEQFLPPPLLQPRAVGNSRAGGRDAAPCVRSGAEPLRAQRPLLRGGPLPGGRDVLRADGAGAREIRRFETAGFAAMSGRLIVLEGLDGSGKATQAKLLCEALARTLREGVRQVSFPN